MLTDLRLDPDIIPNEKERSFKESMELFRRDLTFMIQST